ncbi:alcohol dehydrogenase catalytic domain-containing protein [Pigmentiphaga litoralis]|uniref:D-arabinose 1-dehydrogenase-like Zn-dependent alcohol dehydrogenase n=1 Tax=Pigmentiphaga litoralis TaxID=516702 RepID=A0A7Y9ISR2_9BURK|nr:alcohol dehydrogenase catalytic domain-containing protein [Pigmentiphaga litoralis]NYE24009.1 D-arabinose 1-dehydrogenase-like Zn-dependent alcohol dehydrogenase [Pigmentiphaga litoralis]NYE82377.1 D-arabinose 1-dehydrogenase-like Zn-dependent alcohol dehydrogenase [Pigmentiphaga litoralis]
MKAVILSAFGGPDTLQVQEVDTPRPGPGDVLVRVRAAGICHHDILHRAGKLPGAKTGVVLGHETAGEVIEVGADVITHKVGDAVVIYQRQFCGMCRNCLRGRQDMCRALGLPAVDTVGGYAEYVSVPASMAISVPAGLPWQAAALACCPIGTSLRALRTLANVSPGDSVLITGASGGLGIHQIQIVKALGARSIAVTSSPAKAEHLKALGADEVVVAPDLKFGAEVWRLTGKQGVDVAIDNLGMTLPEVLRTMAQGGIVVVLGNLDGKPVDVSPGLLIGRRIRIAGSGSATLEDIRHALAMLANGQIKPIISATVSFDEASHGHALVDAKAVEGRVVMEGWS